MFLLEVLYFSKGVVIEQHKCYKPEIQRDVASSSVLPFVTWVRDLNEQFNICEGLFSPPVQYENSHIELW